MLLRQAATCRLALVVNAKLNLSTILKFFGWYGLSDVFTKTWRAQSCLCRFQFPSYCCRWRSLSSPGCSLIQIVSSATLGSVTSAWFYPRLKYSLLVFDTSSKISTTNRNSYPLIEEIRPVNDISDVLYLVDPIWIFSPRI